MCAAAGELAELLPLDARARRRKPSSTSSQSVFVARRSDDAYSSESLFRRCSYTASSVASIPK
jgi:hypothetical protein